VEAPFPIEVLGGSGSKTMGNVEDIEVQWRSGDMDSDGDGEQEGGQKRERSGDGVKEEEKWERPSPLGPRVGLRLPGDVGQRWSGMNEVVAWRIQVSRPALSEGARYTGWKGAGELTSGPDPLLNFFLQIFNSYKFCSSIHIPSLCQHFFKHCKVIDSNIGNKCPFWPNFKILLDFEIKILEQIQI
jgi:hypothetical protein